jgi:phosphoglycerate dehydrogenase-like enzyme
VSQTMSENETITIVSFASQNPERQSELKDGVERIFAGRPYRLHFPCDENDASAPLREAEILLTWSTRLTESLFRQAKWLRWAHIGDAGVERCMFPAMVESDVMLTNSSGIHGQYMSEWALAVVLYIAQGLSVADAWKRDRDWKQHKDEFLGRRFLLEGRRALIVGYGAIGKPTAAKFQGIGVECNGVVSSLRPAEIPLYVTRDLPRIIGNYDIVIVAVPFTHETEKLFDYALLQRMKPGSILVNLARGKVIDEPALIETLRNGPLGFAALDVFAKEPLPMDSPFFDLSNVVMTPHVSGNFTEYTIKVQELFLENLKRYLERKPLRNIVDKKRGY